MQRRVALEFAAARDGVIAALKRDRPPSGKSEGGCLLRGTSSIAGEPAAPLLPLHAAEFLFDHGGDGGLDLRMAEAVDNLTMICEFTARNLNAAAIAAMRRCS
jgi:hypothetical protein